MSPMYLHKLLWRAGLIVALGVGLVACGPGRVKPPASAALTTSITPGGLKFFVYSWGDLEDQDLQGARHYEIGNQTTPPGELPPLYYVTDHRDSFEAALKDKLAESNYCRTGYYVLSRHFLPGESRARGECKELATSEDRKEFAASPSP